MENEKIEAKEFEDVLDINIMVNNDGEIRSSISFAPWFRGHLCKDIIDRKIFLEEFVSVLNGAIDREYK